MQIPSFLSRLTLALCALGAGSSAAHGQASFVETFDALGSVAPGAAGPASLEAAGWTFRNQSEPLGSSGWYDGWLFDAFEGSGHLEASSSSTAFLGGDVSLWAILPAVPGQIAGDDVTFHVQRVASSNADRLELRYAPGGGTDTGSGAHDLGDFTELLADVPLATGGWQTVSAPVPGAGRLALRLAIEDACNFACSSSVLGIDLLSVGPAPGPGCNLPPLPEPGQTVHWTAAGGPWEVCADVSVPLGGTVVIDAGAEVVIDPGSTLFVSGDLRAEGTPSQPVLLTGGGNPFAPAVLADGEVELHHVAASAHVQAEHGGSLLAYDSSFTGGLGSADLLGGLDRGTYVHVERCQVSGVDLSATDATLVVVDSDFTGAGLTLLRGYVYVRGVTIDGSGLGVSRERFTQPAYLGDLTVTGSPGPALRLTGWDYLVGDGVVLQGNQVPVRLDGGLLTGSAIPASGNVSNHVDAGRGEIVGSSTWGALDVPYVVQGVGLIGDASLEIDAGATVELGPDAGLLYFAAAGLRARGRADAPVTFRARQPGSSWDRIKFQSTGGRTRFEHAVFEDAQVAVQADGSVVYVDGSTFRQNDVGVLTNTDGLMAVRTSRFLDNLTGAQVVSGAIDLHGATNPNEFVGNGLGVDGGSASARHNWWGSPAGPTHPSNPGGDGDGATAQVPVLPFRTTPVDQADAPPRVELLGDGGLAETGSTVLLHWTVDEDSAVSSQRILYSPHGNLGYSVLAADLPGHQRSYEWSVPLAQLTNELDPAYIRVVAVDDAGQEGWDERPYVIPYTEDLPPYSFEWLTDLSQPFTFGDEFALCWSQTGLSATWNLALLSEGDGRVPLGGGTTLIDCWDVTMPYVSSDHARFELTFFVGAAGRNVVVYSPPMTLRPDARLPDAPPTLTLTAPAPGQVFGGGGSVPLAWTAADDEALRALRVQASYDGGRTFHAVADLPGTATGHVWQLPPLVAPADVVLRVVAVDRRFQTSSDEVALGFTPGDSGWTDLGGGTVGSVGSPRLDGAGALTAGADTTLSVSQVPPGALMLAWVSFSTAPLQVLGGTLHATPFAAQFLVQADGTGAFEVTTPWPAGVPSGTSSWFQVLVQDTGVVPSLTLSNGLRATTP